MKLTTMLLTAAGCAMLTGCDTAPSLLSLDPVTTDRDTRFDARLTGAWESPSEKGTVCVIRRGDPSGYEIAFLGGSSTVGFQAQLFQVGDAELLDVVPSDDNDFRVPGHVIARIWSGEGTLRWAFLDSEWLKKQAAALLNRESGGKFLLLSPGAAVRAFLAANGADDKAYGKEVIWQKVL